jgi:hypothetical protein
VLIYEALFVVRWLTPATMNDDGLADATAANRFRFSLMLHAAGSKTHRISSTDAMITIATLKKPAPTRLSCQGFP